MKILAHLNILISELDLPGENSMYDDVSLLIQGPANDPNKLDFIPYVEYYKTLFSEIILSTYKEHMTDSLREFCQVNNIILVEETINLGNVENKYNIAYQTYTTLNGLKQVSNKYCLKTRTDEGYSNLNKLVDLFLEDDEKWVCGSTVMGPKIYHVFHAADHLFIGKTEKLKKCFEYTYENLFLGIMERNVVGEPAAEVTFTKNFIIISGDTPDLERHDELMLKYFNFVNDREFYPFRIRFNHIPRLYTELSHFHPCWLSYNNMDDILSSRGGMIVC